MYGIVVLINELISVLIDELLKWFMKMINPKSVQDGACNRCFH